jgi:hypothetical protein
MQITALYDSKGRILAAVQVQAESEHGSSTIPQPQPQAKRGQRVGTFTVPSECAHLGFVEACSQLRIKIAGKRATLALSETRSRPKHAPASK